MADVKIKRKVRTWGMMTKTEEPIEREGRIRTSSIQAFY